jgi:hypothetical protein
LSQICPKFAPYSFISVPNFQRTEFILAKPRLGFTGT